MADRTRNRWNTQRARLELSKIFDWYGDDFRQGHRAIPSLAAFAARHAELLADAPADRERIRSEKFDVEFLDYDWAYERRALSAQRTTCERRLHSPRKNPSMKTPVRRRLVAAAGLAVAGAWGLALSSGPAQAQAQASAPMTAGPLKFGVGMFQPDREKNDTTYRPLAAHLAQRLGRPVELRTVDSWEGLARSLATGETDIALMGPWGYVLANQVSDAQVVSTILYQGKPEYFAMIVTHPDSGIATIQDLLGPKGKGRSSRSATRDRLPVI